MENFTKAFQLKLRDSEYNDYGLENWDTGRYGQPTYKPERSLWISMKQAVKKAIGYRRPAEVVSGELTERHAKLLERIYNVLNGRDQNTVVDLMAYRRLGYNKVKLARNNDDYAVAFKTAQQLVDRNETYDPNFMGVVLNRYNLAPIGFDVSLFFMPVGVAIEYIVEQYAYKIENKTVVGVEAGDVVLDLGGCWGDTAHYFACKAGPGGKVYSFEFIPNNIKLFRRNLDLNPNLKEKITIVEHPVSDVSDQLIYYRDNGPGSQVVTNPFEGQTGHTTTLSVDDFVDRNNIQRVDFIKMDIEGSEMRALAGALKTIKKFRPKLAIATYHSIDDFVDIPAWIIDLGLDYKIFIDHYTIHAEETVCFAMPMKNGKN